MDYENLCNKILNLDNRIRYAGIYDAGEYFHKTQKNVTSYLTEEETETNLSQAVYRWSTRKKVAPKIGKAIFSMAKYEKLFRLTFPLSGAGLILISTELDVNPLEISDKILEIIHENTS